MPGVCGGGGGPEVLVVRGCLVSVHKPNFIIDVGIISKYYEKTEFNIIHFIVFE